MATIFSIPQSTTVPTVHTHDLSTEARDYLRGYVRDLRRRGVSAASAATWANEWADGYRAFAAGTHLSQLVGAGFDGWSFAHGEDAWRYCQMVDAAQDSAAAAGWPSSAWW